MTSPERNVVECSRASYADLRIRCPVLPSLSATRTSADNALVSSSFRSFRPWTQSNRTGSKDACRVTKQGSRQKLKLRALDDTNQKPLWQQAGHLD